MAMGTPCYKVILCGDYGVGKSALFRRFVDNSFTTEQGPKSTMGLDYFSKTYTIHGRDVKLEVWDTAGIERFATLSASYYHNAAAAILCYSSVNRDSFNSLPQHLLETIVHGKTAKMFLCSTKNDETQTHDAITDSDVAQFEDQCDTALSATFITSSRDGTGVADMFYAVAEMLVSEDINKFRPKPPPPASEQYGGPAFKLDQTKSSSCCLR